MALRKGKEKGGGENDEATCTMFKASTLQELEATEKF